MSSTALDWGGGEGGNSQLSYDPDDDNFDVDFDQVWVIIASSIIAIHCSPCFNSCPPSIINQ